ncbi:hypothetical protein LY16_01599 [Xenorhabdus doucetiae]|uniref:Uncharacterized protein n=1 Tax=Xenorhabdus doucetiae TaxID=351671 RepID=A0ABY3NS22_9GAMM|nr:hypothetical protein LY16_01599 [Xenorhabdus doucetiae]
MQDSQITILDYTDSDALLLIQGRMVRITPISFTLSIVNCMKHGVVKLAWR